MLTKLTRVSRGTIVSGDFGAEADGNLDDLRQTFLVKAFQRRQVALPQPPHWGGALARNDRRPDIDGAWLPAVDDEGGKLVRRYLERRAVVGPLRADEPAFVDAEGARLKTVGFAAYISGLRRVCVNAEFNGALCAACFRCASISKRPLCQNRKLRRKRRTHKTFPSTRVSDCE